MSLSCSDVVMELVDRLENAGYSFHSDTEGNHWFCWATDRMSSVESGDYKDSELEAQLDAMFHWFANTSIPMEDIMTEETTPTDRRLMIERTHALSQLFDSWVRDHPAATMHSGAIQEVSNALRMLLVSLTNLEAQASTLPPKKYLHTFVIPFTVISEKESYDDLTEEDLEEAFIQRMKEIASDGYLESATYETTIEDYE